MHHDIDTAGQQLIAGKQRRGSSGDPYEVRDPSSDELLAQDEHAAPADVDAAVAAAKAALPDWAGRAPGERSDLMHRLAAEMHAEQDRLAELESRQGGKPIRLAEGFDIPGVLDNVSFFAGAARDLEGKSTGEYSPDHVSSVRREPVGVVASIAAWNYPLQLAAWKVLPALAAGNTVVLKPSELTPLTSVAFARAAQRAGIPDGVFNVVTGSGAHIGDTLVEHPDVAMVSFTGSTGVGRQVAARAAGGAKRVHLELGGKAPFVVFDDADLEAAARGAVTGSLINAGQDCTAATRAYVQRPHFERFTARVAELMRQIVLGPADDESTDLGSLISQEHRDKVDAMVQRARQAGADVVTGGRAGTGKLSIGAYYEPTLITNVAQDSEIVQDEVFGPVLVALPFDSDEQGIRLANDTRYGLAASAWTSSVFRSQRASAEIAAGCVWINDHIPVISEMPHGGYKASGFGKDMSTYSLTDYTQVKHVMSALTPDADKDWHDLVLRGPQDSIAG